MKKSISLLALILAMALMFTSCMPLSTLGTGATQRPALPTTPAVRPTTPPGVVTTDASQQTTPPEVETTARPTIATTGTTSTTVATTATTEPVQTTPVTPGSVYVDIDFDYENNAITDKMGNVVCTPVGKAMVDVVEVTHNGVTVSKSALVINDGSKQSWVECTFTNIADYAQFNKFVEENNGFTVEAFYRNREKSGTQGIVCVTESTSTPNRACQGWGLADAQGSPYFITGSGKPSNGWCFTDRNAFKTNTTDLYHVVCVYDAAEMRNSIYINGELISSAAAPSFSAVNAYGKDSTGEKAFNMGNGFFLGGEPTVYPHAAVDFPASDLAIVDVKIYAGARVATVYAEAVAEFKNTEPPSDVTGTTSTTAPSTETTSTTVTTATTASTVAVTPGSVYVDIDFDYDNNAITDKMGNVVCTPVGKAVVDAVEVTHNGVTISKSALVINDESKQSWVECTFTNIIDHAQLNKLVEEMNGWTVEAFYLNADKTSIIGIVCATEGNGRDDNGNAYGRQGWGIADNKGYPYYIFGTRGKYWSTTSHTTTGTNNSDFVHVMGVYDAVAKTNTLYINGVVVKSAMADGFVASQAFGKDSTGEKVFNIGTGFFIGADPTVAAPTSDYPARDLKVADVKIYAGALTESEALEAYKNATAEFTDNSANKDAAENAFVSAGYNLDDYTRLEISPTLHAYYNSTSASKSNLVQNGTSNELLFWATQLFTKEEIPVGSVIVIADGYQYRPEGWQSPDMHNTNLRPGNTRSTITVVDDSWWSDFTVRGFNISSVSAQTITENDYGAFAVFVPKKDADTPEDIVVFLDPGHGGTDTGSTKEYDGVVYKESDINLAVALKAKAKLEALGYKVILSRTDDTYIQVSDRPAAAIAANANMFVSIHVNSAIDDIAKGFEAYYSGKNVNYDAKAFAEIFTNEFAKIKDITSSDNLNVLAYPDMTIRGTKADTKLYTNGLAVLNQKESDMPSALLELGFMTNETDFLMLRSAYWQNFAAEAIANAVVAAHAAGIYKK